MLLFILLSSTQAATYIVNPEHSKIKFSIGYMGLSKVEGLFQKYDIFYKTKDNKVTEIKGVIKAGTVDTNDKKRDSHLRKSDFFDVNKHPLIEFKNINSFPLKDSDQVIELEVNLKGVKKVIPFKARYQGERVDPWTKTKGYYFLATGKISRKDFGMTWNKLLDDGSGYIISDTVELEISIEAYHANKKPAFSRFYKPKKKHINKNIELKKKFKINKTSTKDIKKTEAAPKRMEYWTKENAFYTILTGFPLFLLTIATGIGVQIGLVRILEKFKINDRYTYVISSTITMIIIIILSIFTAPYMGWGTNPLLK
jgi:polyisoprenoid-binding protein YceI